MGGLGPHDVSSTIAACHYCRQMLVTQRAYILFAYDQVWVESLMGVTFR